MDPTQPRMGMAINTSYGQGTDVLSLKQYHVLLALKHFGSNGFIHQEVNEIKTLYDIAPTVLDLADLPPLENIDGVSLLTKTSASRSVFLETGYNIAELTSGPNIDIHRVIGASLPIYKLDPKTGQLFVTPEAHQSIVSSKQRALIKDGWLLARYPEEIRKNTLYQDVKAPPYYVLVNLKTGLWTVGLREKWLKQTPLKKLKTEFDAFFGEEVK